MAPTRADLGCFGRRNISTPNVDALAAAGLKLTQWLSAAPICTPSRAGLQTGERHTPRRIPDARSKSARALHLGLPWPESLASATSLTLPPRQPGRYPRRFGMTANSLPWRTMATPSQPTGFPESEVTMAEALRTRGYATALAGKWYCTCWPYPRRSALLLAAHALTPWPDPCGRNTPAGIWESTARKSRAPICRRRTVTIPFSASRASPCAGRRVLQGARDAPQARFVEPGAQ